MRRHRQRHRMVEPELLARFEPMARLRPDERIVLASRAGILRLQAGRHLFHPDRENVWAYFLLAGRLRLTSSGGESFLVESGDAHSRLALSSRTYQQYKAVTLTAVEVVRIEARLVEGISGSAAMATPPRQDVCCDDRFPEWIKGLFEDVRDSIDDDQLTLPVPPAFGDQIAELVANEHLSEARLVEVICSDPGICAKLLRVANGALFHEQRPILDCETAVRRLGRRATRHLVMNYAFRDRLRNPDEGIRQRLNEYWLTSTSVAAISVVLASRIPSLPAPRCRIAGLLHDIGTLALLAFAHQFPGALLDPGAVSEAMDALSRPLGAYLVRAWGLGDDLLPVLDADDDWFRSHQGETDLADLILVARAHSRIDPKRGTAGPPDPGAMPAFERLGLNAEGADEGLSIVVQAQEFLEAAQGFLQGPS